MAVNPFLTQPSLRAVLKDLMSLAAPLRPMWPWFSVKIAAAQWEGDWQILYLGVAGQFAEPSDDDIFTTGYLLTATLKLPATDLWNFLTQLVVKGEALLWNWSFKISPEQQSTDCSLWSKGTGAIPPGIRDVCVPVEHSMACLTSTANWPRPSKPFDDYVMKVKADLAVSTNYVGEIDQFIHRQVGFTGSMRTCRIEFHLPVGMVVERQASQTEQSGLSFRIRATNPLRPDELRLEYSADMRYRNELPCVLLNGVTEEGSGWWQACFQLPTAHGMLLVRHPYVSHPLAYEYPEDPVPDQLIKLISFIYDSARPARGKGRWLDGLRAGSGGPLEVALHNALARFGWPAFFTGDLSNGKSPSDTKDAAPEGVYPQTEGFDLAILDSSRRRMMLVSIKGTGVNKFNGMQWEVAKLNEVLTRVRKIMPGWNIYGRLVCNKISASRMEVLPSVDGLLYSGEEWIERLLVVGDPTSAEYLLWPMDSQRNGVRFP